MSTNTQIIEAMETYLAESAKFEEKGVKASAARYVEQKSKTKRITCKTK